MPPSGQLVGVAAEPHHTLSRSDTSFQSQAHRKPRGFVRRREIMQTVQSQLVTVAISFLRTFGLFSGASGILGLLSSGVGAMAGDRR